MNTFPTLSTISGIVGEEIISTSNKAMSESGYPMMVKKGTRTMRKWAVPYDGDTFMTTEDKNTLEAFFIENMSLPFYWINANSSIEVQSIVCTTPWATGSVYTITHGTTGLTAIQGSTQTLAGLVSVFQGLSGYANAPFTITAGTNALTLTWKTIGAVFELASMVKNYGSAVSATRTTNSHIVFFDNPTLKFTPLSLGSTHYTTELYLIGA